MLKGTNFKWSSSLRRRGTQFMRGFLLALEVLSFTFSFLGVLRWPRWNYHHPLTIKVVLVELHVGLL